MTPGPEERKLRNRVIFKITGRWPQSVVDERLAAIPSRAVEAQRRMNQWTKELWCSKPSDLWPEEKR